MDLLKEIEEIILADEQTQKQLQGEPPQSLGENHQYCRLMWVEFIGFLAAFLSTAAFVPQAYKIYKENGQKGLTMYLVMLSGVLSWEVYGLMIGKWLSFWQI